MIINIRGTSGSGKSTVARQLIERFGAAPWSEKKDDVINGYYSDQLFVLGRYTTPCGGCDTIKTQNDIVRLVHIGNQLSRNVVFEGALISTIAERYLKMADYFTGKFIFAMLDTPFEVCVERILQRRAEKGNTKPLNLVRTTEKFTSTQRFIRQYSETYDVRVVNHLNAYPEILSMLK